jgi:hypothetical protein
MQEKQPTLLSSSTVAIDSVQNQQSKILLTEGREFQETKAVCLLSSSEASWTTF